MRKILLILFAVTFVSSLCFAQQESTPVKADQKSAKPATSEAPVAPTAPTATVSAPITPTAPTTAVSAPVVSTPTAPTATVSAPITPTAPVIQTAPKPVETKTFTGKVESISLADSTKGIKSEIVVVDEKGQKLTFTVRTTATIADKDGKSITLGKIAKDNKVVIEYTTKKDTNRAKSIKLVE